MRDAALEKVPYVLVLGDRELADRAVRVRYRGSDEGPTTESAWLARLREQVEARDDDA